MQSRPSWIRLAISGAFLWLACSAPPPPQPTPPLTAPPLPTGDAFRGSEDGAVLLRRAVELEAAGRIDDALAELESLRTGPLAAHVALLRTRMLRTALRSNEAIATAQPALAARPPREIAAKLQAEVAAVYLQRGALLDAYEAQKQAWELSLDAERASQLAFSMAELLEDGGSPAEAQTLYREIWQRWPVSRVGYGAYTRWRQLASPGNARSAIEDVLKLAVAQREAAHCELTLDIVNDLPGRPALTREQIAEVRSERATCSFQRRRYTEATELFEQILRADPANSEAAISAARARGRAGDPARAVKDLDGIAKRFTDGSAPRASLLAALLQQDRDEDDARRRLREIAKGSVDPATSREARWQLAWDSLERGDVPASLEWLAPLAQGDPTDVEVSRARYWRAVASLASRPTEAQAELRQIAESGPLSYYGLLAAERLGFEPQVERPILGDPEPETNVESLRVASTLIRAGLREQSLDELSSWLADNPSLSRGERVRVAKLLHESGDHYRAVNLIVDGFGSALDRGIDPRWRDVWQAAWPLPFEQNVRSASAEFTFDPALVYSIMREESLYRPRVESSAGARGLMQLIPPTAQRIAKTIGVRPFAPDLLYEPAVNVRLGTYYLRELSRKFSDSRPLVIAAYNAGPEAVTTWRKEAGTFTPDRFVDSVPYSETRRYLRRVLRSYHVYRLLYPGQVTPPATPPAQPGA